MDTVCSPRQGFNDGEVRMELYKDHCVSTYGIRYRHACRCHSILSKGTGHLKHRILAGIEESHTVAGRRMENSVCVENLKEGCTFSFYRVSIMNMRQIIKFHRNDCVRLSVVVG